ncbi:hypothetical protein TNCV_1478101 [Trichonephila clavipes]|nr:hypothetical protein TNCV_1478101 [Trichonephila clavipes]
MSIQVVLQGKFNGSKTQSQDSIIPTTRDVLRHGPTGQVFNGSKTQSQDSIIPTTRDVLRHGPTGQVFNGSKTQSQDSIIPTTRDVLRHGPTGFCAQGLGLRGDFDSPLNSNVNSGCLTRQVFNGSKTSKSRLIIPTTRDVLRHGPTGQVFNGSKTQSQDSIIPTTRDVLRHGPTGQVFNGSKTQSQDSIIPTTRDVLRHGPTGLYSPTNSEFRAISQLAAWDERRPRTDLGLPSYIIRQKIAIVPAGLCNPASVKLTYSASMVDRLTDFCLKFRHKIGVSSIKVMNPPIDTRSSLFVAKSESE